MDDSVLQPIIGIVDGKLRIERDNGTIWEYVYKSWEVSEEMEKLLIDRQNNGWGMLAIAKLLRQDGKRYLKLEGLGL